MDGFLLLTFASLAALAAVLELFKRRTSKLDTTNREFLRFRANYVLVYALMMGGTPCAYTHLCLHYDSGNKLYLHVQSSVLLCHAHLMSCRSLTLLKSAAGDWLQGPYVYALYLYYGFDRGQIGRLFIGGFASSMVFGTIAGSLADK